MPQIFGSRLALLPLMLSIVVARPFGFVAGQRGERHDGFEAVVLQGTVVDLAALLKARGIGADSDPIARQVVLKGEDGAVTPLLSDEASRALFKDVRLQGRRTVVTGRRYPGLPYFQVVSFQVEEEGRLRTPEYYCDVCTISVRFPQICPCCQGPMVLRMKSEAR